jgi:uncharacterized membrane protein YpjA
LQEGVSLSLFWSRSFLTSRIILWTLFIINLAGTIYGYEWYWGQMEVTLSEKPIWYVIFVPDSPTASLFFTLSLLYMLRDKANKNPLSKVNAAVRAFVEAFALITSFKYGIWAVTMIAVGAAQGDPVAWQDGMLTVSHLGMAAEALLFARFYTYRIPAIFLVAIWTFWNDFMDYQRGIFPWLPDKLMDNLDIIEWFTVGLSVMGILIALFMMKGIRTIKKVIT